MTHSAHFRSGRTWVWILVITLIVLPFLGIYMYRVSGDRALEKKIEALQAQGQPVTLSELNDRYSLPLGVENAADYYLDAFDNHVKWDQEEAEGLPVFGQAEFPARTAGLEPSMKALINDYLQDNQEVLSTLHEAATMPHCRYPVDFTDGFNARIYWLGPLRDSARLLQLQALITIDNNDLDAAFQSIRCSMALGQSIQANTLVEQLVRIAVFALNLNTIERLLNQCDLSDEQLQSLTSLIESEDVKSGLYAAFQGERCMGLAIFKSPSSAAADGLGQGFPVRAMAPLRAIGYLQRDTITYLDLMQNYLDRLEQPSHIVMQLPQDEERGGLFTRILAPALGRVSQLAFRAQTDQKTAITACAIERYRIAHQQLPAALQDLVPAYLEAVPLDPFDGEPLRYKKLAPGYVVYSVGDDLSDDGGQELKRKRGSGHKPQPWDVTFIVERE